MQSGDVTQVAHLIGERVSTGSHSTQMANILATSSGVFDRAENIFK
jgi:hypothetical protein